MTLVLKTPEDSTADHPTPAGTAFAGGRGGIVVEEAAESFAEFQQRDAAGALVLNDDGDPVPLEGKELKAAAKAFADARGLVIQDVKDVSRLRFEAGVPADAPNTLSQGAVDEFQRRFPNREPLTDEDQKTLQKQGQSDRPTAATQQQQAASGDDKSKGGSR